MVKGLVAAALAISPFVAGAVALEGFAVDVTRPTPERELVFGAGTTAEVARRNPGRAAISVDDLGAHPSLDHLPFEVAVLDGATGDLGPGLAALTQPGTWRARARWSVLESWTTWQVSAEHAGGPTPCTARFLNGGYGCGRGVRFIPDIVVLDGEALGAVRITAVPAASVARMTVPAMPRDAIGTLYAIGGGAAKLVLVRGDTHTEVSCGRRCDFTPPPGPEALVIEIRGPSSTLAFDLRAPRPGSAP